MTEISLKKATIKSQNRISKLTFSLMKAKKIHANHAVSKQNNKLLCNVNHNVTNTVHSKNSMARKFSTYAIFHYHKFLCPISGMDLVA